MFRLLDLPLVPLDRVISLLPVLDIFDFSLCSKKCENIVKSSHGLPKPRIRIFLIQEREGSRLEFMDEKADELDGLFLLQKGNGLCTAERTIERMRIKCWKDELSDSGPLEHLSAEMRNILIDRFASLFGRDRVLHQLILDFYNTDLPNIATLVDNFDICERLITFGTIPDEILDVLISKLTITKKLKLSRNSGIYFEPSRPLQLVADKVNLAKCWITPEQFLKSDCSQIILQDCAFSDSVFQQFVSQWFETGNTRLQYAVAFGQAISADPLNLDVFGECKRWDPAVRSQYYPVNKKDVLDMSSGVDILREDGLLTTVSKMERTFMFVIWHNRFPQLPKNHFNNIRRYW